MILFVLVFAVLAVLGFIYGGSFFGQNGALIGVGLSIPVGLVLSIIIRLILKQFGSSGNVLYGSGQKAQWNIREQFSANLSQAKHGMENEKYDEAMTAINGALKQDPNWPEALFLKAKIMQEGFENTPGAIRYLKQVIKVSSDKEEINEEALALFKELSAQEKLKKKLAAK